MRNQKYFTYAKNGYGKPYDLAKITFASKYMETTIYQMCKICRQDFAIEQMRRDCLCDSCRAKQAASRPVVC